MFAVGPDSVLCLRTNGLLFLLVSIRELLRLHAAAAALTSCLFVFFCLILLLHVKCWQKQNQLVTLSLSLMLDVADWCWVVSCCSCLVDQHGSQ